MSRHHRRTPAPYTLRGCLFGTGSDDSAGEEAPRWMYWAMAGMVAFLAWAWWTGF